MKNPLAVVRNDRGYSLLLILVAAGISIIMILGNAYLMRIQTRKSGANNLHLSAMMLRNNVLQVIRNTAAWQQTVLDTSNPSLQCLRDGGSCAALDGSAVPVTFVRDHRGQVFLRTDQPYVGWDDGAEPCAAFEASNLSCAFRYEITWEPECNGVPGCSNPPYWVTARLRVSDALEEPFNTDSYTIRIRKN